jgi:conserved domain protein
MKIPKVKDNTTYITSRFSCNQCIVSNILNKSLNQLDAEGLFIFPEAIKKVEDLTRDQMILQEFNGKYRTGNVMGFIGYGKERLIIQSRFCNDKEDYFLSYLLERVLNIPNIVSLDADTSSDKRLLNFLLFIFPKYLENAIRKGLYKQYIHKKYNDTNIKGKIDIPRHLTKNTPFIGSIAYSQRLFSYDNMLMELIRHTIEFIKSKSYGSIILSDIKEELKLIVNATQSYRTCDRQKIIEQNKKNPIRHAYFREYSALQRLCILILKSEKHDIGSGIQNSYGILFDGAWLWEEYINILLSSHFYHPKNKSKFGAQQLFSDGKGLIYPDFISKSTDPRLIVDAKYKLIENIRGRDYLQVLAYMYRFDASKGYYIYPDSEGQVPLVLNLNKGSTYENNVSARNDVNIIKLGFKIPNKSADYDDFKMQIHESELVLQNFINSQI